MPELRPFSPIVEIPAELRQHKRWTPWAAQWSEKRGKFLKVPRFAHNPSIGLSTVKSDQWVSYPTALAAQRKANLAGLGYLMTGPHGVIGVDLDGCVEADGSPNAFARTIIDRLASYTERSPSGNGFRIMCRGEIEDDWNNHDVGIEVYGGHEARFLTITGDHVPGTPLTVREVPARVWSQLAATHAKVKHKADVIDLTVPDVLDDIVLPDLERLPLPVKVQTYLTTGEHGGDRSRALHAAGVALCAAGLPDDQVFSLLANNPHAMGTALDHRDQDNDRAHLYLWREHVLKARPKATGGVASMEEFDAIADEVGDSGAPAKPGRWTPVPAVDFASGPLPTWLIKNVLQQAEVGVVFGESGSGKSFFILDLAAHLGAGLPWRGNRTKQCRVIYIAAEGAGGFRKRLQAYAIHHGMPLDQLKVEVIDGAPNLLMKPDALELAKAIGQAGAIFIDTLAQTTPGANENASEDMGRALAHAKGIARATGALVILVHHAGKDLTKGARGWSGLKAAADFQMDVMRLKNGRKVRLDKSKDGKDGTEWGFELEVVRIGVDEDGDVIDSCVAVEAAVPTGGLSLKRTLGAVETVVVEVVAEMGLAQSAGIEVEAVLREVVSRMPPPTEGRRDTRKQQAKRALVSLSTGDDAPFAVEDDCLEIL